MNGKEGLSCQGEDKSVGFKSAGTVHGVFSGSCLSGEMMRHSSRAPESLTESIRAEEVATILASEIGRSHIYY